MTTQGERTPTPGDGREGQAGQRTGGGADPRGGDAEGTADRTGTGAADRTGAGATAARRRGRRLTGRRAAGWIVVVGVVVAGGWIITRPMPGDYIPGLGPSTKDSAKTPPVVGSAPALTDPEALNVDNIFPAQRPVEVGAYKARRNGARQGENCAEVLQDRAQDPLKDSGCQAYLTVSFTGQDRPVLSSVTLLRFPDQAAATRAADALRAKPGSVAFILENAVTAPAPPAGTKPGGEPRVEAVGHYVTVTSSRAGDGRPASATPSGTGSPAAQTPTPTGTAAGTEQNLDEATRAISYAAGQPFVWM
ncbi:hypothetical protein GCM10018790_49770 [Kitasatospora xanthocidica]|uniref:hypothetical protein n=1 Tax=Kitasatospora xanthocidica TaxID=83382 RepID=UPI00167B82F8|nr:hypothetical protein [Kitasatospora xanthocidica]GHF65981.1 hypothetical protein GCM10018790_49770 [Kitasatospora xanthocidica]